MSVTSFIALDQVAEDGRSRSKPEVRALNQAVRAAVDAVVAHAYGLTVWKITQSLREKHPAPLANTNVMQPAELEGRAKTVFIDESDGQRDWRGLRTMVDGGYGRWRSTTQQRLAVDVLPPGQTFDASALHGYRALILAIGPEGEAALSEHHVAAVKDFVRE
jgi:hypothetical protein